MPLRCIHKFHQRRPHGRCRISCNRQFLIVPASCVELDPPNEFVDYKMQEKMGRILPSPIANKNRLNLRRRQCAFMNFRCIFVVDQFFGHSLCVEIQRRRLPNRTTFEHTKFLLIPFGHSVTLQQREQFPAIVNVSRTIIFKQKSTASK